MKSNECFILLYHIHEFFGLSRITVETSQKVVHTEVCEHSRKEADDGDKGGTTTSPSHHNPGVEIQGKNEPSD